MIWKNPRAPTPSFLSAAAVAGTRRSLCRSLLERRHRKEGKKRSRCRPSADHYLKYTLFIIRPRGVTAERRGGKRLPMASSSAPLPPLVEPPAEEPKQDLLKQIRSHEVALAELNCLPPNRAVYQRNGNIFFQKNVKAAAALEQKQLNSAKAQLQKLSTV